MKWSKARTVPVHFYAYAILLFLQHIVNTPFYLQWCICLLPHSSKESYASAISILKVPPTLQQPLWMSLVLVLPKPQWTELDVSMWGVTKSQSLGNIVCSPNFYNNRFHVHLFLVFYNWICFPSVFNNCTFLSGPLLSSLIKFKMKCIFCHWTYTSCCLIWYHLNNC